MPRRPAAAALAAVSVHSARLRAARTAGALALAAALLAPGAPTLAQVGDAALGRQLYVEGLAADGAPISGTIQGDVPVSGRAFPCVSCHRPSGFGTSEGGNFVPPVTGPVLFAPRQPDRNAMFREMYQEVQPNSYWARVREARMRPAYDADSLGRALRDGVDPGGNALSEVMPRYDLPPADLANLTAYLRTLSASPDPGVDATTLHIATVFTPEADPGARGAVLRTIETFVAWMNVKIAGDRQNPTFSPGFKSDFLPYYRDWKLHVWDLTGPPDTWTGQLERLYEQQPVFIVLGGVAPGPWDVIGGFCDANRLPCLLPETQLPGADAARGGYSFFFNRGLELEADVMAAHLSRAAPAPRRILQLHAEGPLGARPAQEFVAAAQRLLPGAEVETIAYADAASLAAALAAQGAEGGAGGHAADTVVIWPDDANRDLAALRGDQAGGLVGRLPAGLRLMLPAAALDAARGFPADLAARTRLTWPYEGPKGYHPRQYEVRAWMHTRRLKVSHPRLQLQTYYALTLLQFGLMHAIGDFHRDYLIEIIEHEAENDLNPGTHPALALGPGQRIASKGAFVIAPDPSERPGYRVVSDWIIPEF